MSGLADALAPFRAWTEPTVVEEGASPRICRFEAPASAAEIAQVTEQLPAGAPPEALELWSLCRTARLCEAYRTGQAGLVLLDPTSAMALTVAEHAERPEDHRPGDVVIGQFLGDVEYLLLSPGEPPGRRVLATLPMDERDLWAPVGDTLAQFLTRYHAERGVAWWDR